jgi:hypothetical protein
MNRRISMMLAAAASLALPAQAGLFRDVYYALDLLATPSGFPISTSADGTRTNGQRAGRLRIVPDVAGRGYTLEFDRTFGRDSRGRPEILDLGPFELQLSGPTQATLGYTRRGGLLTGNAEIQLNNLNYAITGKTGAQDFQISGTLSGQTSLEINRLGFYTLYLDLSNTNSQVLADGVLVDGDTDANFDIGPISLKGNIFVDALGSLLAALGVDTTGLQQLFPESPLDRIAAAIQQQMSLPGLVAGVTYSADGQLPPVPSLTQRAAPSVSESSQTAPATGLVPEPPAFLLLALGVALTGSRRRWR